jgi:hypothetical protein
MTMPRFVVLEHDYPERHWDFMLEVEGVLRTWRLPAPPQAGMPQAAEASFDHRLMYLDYEGPVRGNRGQVIVWDRGTYEEEVPAAEEKVIVRLYGKRLTGKAKLQRVASPGNWTFQLH